MHSEHSNRYKYSYIYIYTVYITFTYTFLYAALQDSLVGFFVVLLQVHMAKFISSGKYICKYKVCLHIFPVCKYKCAIQVWSVSAFYLS